MSSDKIVRGIRRIAWVCLLVSLPVTSFPYFPPAIGGEALVRPLALYPLAVLIAVTILPSLVLRRLPKTTLALLLFVLIALISSLLSLLRGIEPALGISATARVLRGVFTLGIGCAIYLAFTLLPRSEQDLRFSLRWVYLGCGLAMLWGALQAIYVAHFNPAWFESLSGLQRFISIRRLLPDRISGLTYEPHWFADQMVLLVLPWALASVITGYSAFRWRWRGLTIEWLMAGCLVLLLPFTYSRAGVLNLMAVALLGLLLWGHHFFRRVVEKISRKIGRPAPISQPRLALVGYLLSIPLAVACLLGPAYLIGGRNAFFARLWGFWQQGGRDINMYMRYLGLEARLSFAEAAYHTYQAYPALGVGLGNYAFYFEEMLPDRPLVYQPEVLHVITPERGRDRLVTSKNFYLRLLAETGIAGTIAFTAFLVALFGCALYLWLSPRRRWKYWGAASLLGLAGFAISALTFDSFVIPNMWVVFGMITSAAWICQNGNRT